METLNTVLRAIRGEKDRRDHLHVFREFLACLDRAAKRGKPRAVKRTKPNGKKETR